MSPDQSSLLTKHMLRPDQSTSNLKEGMTGVIAVAEEHQTGLPCPAWCDGGLSHDLGLGPDQHCSVTANCRPLKRIDSQIIHVEL